MLRGLFSGRRRSAQSRAGGPHIGDTHGRRERRRSLRQLLQVVAQVPGNVVQRPAGREHVDKPEQRRPQLTVLGSQLHGPGIEDLHGVPADRGERGR